MAARAILDVEINTAAFDEFAASFNKWQGAFQESPEQWQAFAEAMGAAVAGGAGLDELAHAIHGVGKEMGVVSAATESAIAGMSRLEIATERTHGTINKVAEAARSIGNAFMSAAKWATIGGGLAGLATGVGLFGLDSLARQVTTARRAAGGLGLDMADLSAFRASYSQLIDAEGLLGNVAGARNDVDKQWLFRALGIGGDQESRLNNADLSALVIDQVRGLVKDVPEEMLGAFAKARGLDQLLGIEDLRRLRREPAEEFGIARRGFEQDRQAFRIPEAEQLAWRDFYRALNKAGVLIDTALINTLSGLAGPLTHLSQSIADVIKSFLGAPVVKEAIDGLATALDSKEIRDALEGFSKYLLDKNGLSADVRRFFVGTHDLIEDAKATFADAKVVFHELRGLLETKLDPEIDIFGLKLHPFKLDTPGTGPGVADSPAAHTFGPAWRWLERQFNIPTSDARTESGVSFPGAGDERIAAIRDKLARDLQISPDVAAGFLSAPYAESGLRGILQHDKNGNEIPGGDAGWSQWHGPRRDAFMAWAKEHGLDWRSDAANLGFMEEELRGTKSATLLRLRNARTAREGADAGDKYEGGERHGPGDYFYDEHTRNADRFARLPSPGAAAPPRAAPPLAAPPAPVPAVPPVPYRTENSLGTWGNQSLTDALTKAVRAAFATSGQIGGKLDININNETASRVAVSARGVAV